LKAAAMPLSLLSAAESNYKNKKMIFFPFFREASK